MARKFNLQPWRAQRREEQRKTFTYATIAIIIVCALALAANYWYETNYIEQQEVAKEQIKSETAKLSKAKSEVERLTELNRQVNLFKDYKHNAAWLLKCLIILQKTHQKLSFYDP